MRVGFPRHVLNDVHSKVKAKFFKRSPTNEDNSNLEDMEDGSKPTISLPHNLFVSQYVKPVFRANNCQVVNKSSNTLRKSLVHNKPPQCSDMGAVPGVYQVP